MEIEIEYIDKFEYINIDPTGYSIKKTMAILNELGNEGWEFVTKLNIFNKTQFLLKRKITIRK